MSDKPVDLSGLPEGFRKSFKEGAALVEQARDTRRALAVVLGAIKRVQEGYLAHKVAADMLTTIVAHGRATDEEVEDAVTEDAKASFGLAREMIALGDAIRETKEMG